MKYKALFVFFMFVVVSYSTFHINSIDISIYVKSDHVHVIESIDLFIDSEVDIIHYSGGLNNNYLSFWAKLIGDKDISLHLDQRYVNITNLKIRPQPIRNYDKSNNRANGEIIISYDAYPYYVNGSILNGTGVFFKEKIKPRVLKYTLNPRVFSFMQLGNNLFLDTKTKLRIYLPENSLLIDINPKPSNKINPLPTKVGYVYWTNTLLPNFTLVLEVKKSINDEIQEFFGNKVQEMFYYLSLPIGIISLIYSVIIIAFYIYVMRIIMRWNK